MSTPDPTASTATYCYRHPDREAYIRCARCERFICPDCMTSASVGFQCPECVAAGQASTREVQSRYGGSLAQRPTVTMTLIGLCVAVFGYQLLAGLDQVVVRYGSVGVLIAGGDYWRLVSVMFLHGSLMHLLFNMYALWLIGRDVEHVLGHVRYLVVYLVAGFGGSVASYAFGNPLVPSVGASGAIFGLMGSVFVLARALRGDVRNVLALIGINLVIGFVVPGIDWRAHVGGLVTGALVTAILVYAPKRNRTLLQVLGVGAVLAVLVAVTVVRTEALQPLVQLVGGLS